MNQPAELPHNQQHLHHYIDNSEEDDDSVTLNFNDQNPYSNSNSHKQSSAGEGELLPLDDEEDTAEISAPNIHNTHHDDISFNAYGAGGNSHGKESPQWSSSNQNSKVNPSGSGCSFRNLKHFDSEQKHMIIPLTGRTHGATTTEGPGTYRSLPNLGGQQRFSCLFFQFAEKLLLREQLCGVQEHLQQFESIVLTMCCKENPDLYNNLIIDLQGFGDMNQGTHVDVLHVVKIQTERLSQLLTCYLASKYDMNKFGELMCNIISPSAGQSIQVPTMEESLDQKQNLRQKSFSFEGSSAGNLKRNHLSSGNNQKSKVSSQQANPFHLDHGSSSPASKVSQSQSRESTPTEEEPTTEAQQQFNQQQSQRTEDLEEEDDISPRSPLRLEEVKLCNEMIDRLRAECQEYELTIVEQDREIDQLREMVKTTQQIQQQQPIPVAYQQSLDFQEHQSLISRLSQDLRASRQETQDTQSQLQESAHAIHQLQEQLKDLKQYQNEPRRSEIRRDAELQMTARELEGLRSEHAQVLGQMQDLQGFVRQQEQQIVEGEKMAQGKIMQAQRDAEECITYFKALALQAKGKTLNSPTNDDHQTQKRGQLFPTSLAPSQGTEIKSSTVEEQDPFRPRHAQDDNVKQRRAKSAGTHNKNQFMRNEDFSFQLQPQNDSLRLQDSDEPTKLLIAIEAMTRSFEEVAQTKQGLLFEITNFRDLFCDQQQKFSVMSYDYIDKLQMFVTQEHTISQELEKSSAQVSELKSVTAQQSKHIKAQHELIMAQKDKLSMFQDFTDKQLKKKEKDRQQICRFAVTELPLMAEGIQNSVSQIDQLRVNELQAQSDLQELLKIQSMTKTKVRLLEEELDKILNENQENQLVVQEQQARYDRLAGLIQDVWHAEVREYQQGPAEKQFSFVRDQQTEGGSDDQSALSEDREASKPQQVPMPVNWLSEIRDTLRQLRDANDFQKDECFQMLNMINTSMHNEQLERTETDGHTFQASDDQSDVDDDDDDVSSRGIDDLGSEGPLSQGGTNRMSSMRRHQKYQSTSRSRPITINSPRPTQTSNTKSKSITSGHSIGRSNRKLQQHMTEKHELNERSMRATSADHQFRGLTSQRTPKNVRFNQPVMQSSYSLGGGKLNQLSAGSGGSINNHTAAAAARNELQQMLRDEIYKLKKDYTISKETVVQMQSEIKNLRRDLHDANCDNDQSNSDLQIQISRSEQLVQDLKDAQGLIEATEETLALRDETIEQLKGQIEDFECELSDLQQSMANVASLNQEISQQCEHWELCHQAAQQDLQQLRDQSDLKIQKLQLSHDDKLKSYKKKSQEKDSQLQSFQAQLQVQQQFRQSVEHQRTNVQNQSTETDNYCQSLEQDNESLKNQLQHVKQDVTAVLEQYDRQQNLNKSLRKKYDKSKSNQQQATAELQEATSKLREVCEQHTDKSAQIDKIQLHYQGQLQHEHEVNQQLQTQIEEVTSMADELQLQIQSSSQDNEDLKRQFDMSENAVKTLEQKIRDMLSDNHGSQKMIMKLREKIASLKRKRAQTRQNYHGLSQITTAVRGPSAGRTGATVSQNSQDQFSSEGSQSPPCSEIGTTNHHIMVSDQHQLPFNDPHYLPKPQKRPNSRGHYNTSHQQHLQKMRQQNISPQPQQNPFANISNMSCNLDSLKDNLINPQCTSVASCYCGGGPNCIASQHTKPSFFQPSVVDHQYQELKWKADAEQLAKTKTKKVVKFIEDLLKNHCRQFIETTTQTQESQLNLNRHMQEWSAEQLLDCWATEESALIEAKAYFNKHSPVIVTCLKLLMDHKSTSGVESQVQLLQPPTLASSQFQIPVMAMRGGQEAEDSQQSTQRSHMTTMKQQDDHQQVIEAYGLLANHCQTVLQSYIQTGRSLAGICFGGCILVGNNLSQDVKEQVDFAMKFLNQDTSLVDSTNEKTMQEIQKVIENLVSCMQGILKTSCQVILNKSSMSKSEANKMLESVSQSCEYSVASGSLTRSVHSKSNSQLQQQQSVQQAPEQNQKEVKEKLQQVEDRLKQKFQQITKLETSLDKLLSQSSSHDDFSKTSDSQQSIISNFSSVLNDTKTVLKLLSTVKRVVSKLKIELHQDYLSLGNINIGLLRPSTSMTSYNLSETHQLQKDSSAQVVQSLKENSKSGKLKEEMSKIISEMSGLTFDDSLPPLASKSTQQQI